MSHPEAAQPAAGRLSIEVDGVAWLAEGALLMVGTLDRGLQPDAVITLQVHGQTSRQPVSWVGWPDHDGGGPGLAAVSRSPVPAAFTSAEVDIAIDGHTASRATIDAARVSELQAVVRLYLAGLPATVRSSVVSYLVHAAAGLSPLVGWSQMATGLHLVREALRERLDASVVGADAPQVLCVDRLITLSERSYFVAGWLRDADGPITRLAAVSPEGACVDLLGQAWFHPRRDLAGLFPKDRYRSHPAAGLGFVCYFEVPEGSHLADGWIVEMTGAGGRQLEATTPRSVVDPGEALDAVLDHLNYERLPADELRARHIRPAVDALLPRWRPHGTVVREAAYGRPPDQPVVSVIVPLYGRIDLVEHQLAQFSADPDWADTELIYVLDSPDLDPALADLAPHLHQLYGVAFQTLSLEHNGGFATATNVGCAHASSSLLLLMNSDVLPAHSGWLTAMISFYEQTPGLGALAPKLLFEDDTLQHAGIYFARLPSTGLWDNRHYYKGLDTALPPANVARPVPAVTAACLLTSAEVYRQLGGLSGDYIQGDYEDTDFCLRLSRAGLASWYLPQVELYHLEGQSYPSAARQRNLGYNRWLHTYRWSADIEALMARLEGQSTTAWR
jgi:GT2 family glycosyltransferase